MRRLIVGGVIYFHPEWIDLARSNLDRWALRTPGLPIPRCEQEWRHMLERPVDEIASAMVSESDHAQWLRQSSPFAGALSPQEVREIRRKWQDDTRRP